MYLGHLDARAPSRDVDAQSSIDLPLWIARPLVARSVVSGAPPPAFCARTRSALQADATCVRLRGQSPYFYELGLAVCALCASAEAAALPELLRRTLATRYEAILDKAVNSRGRDVAAFTRHLSALEAGHFAANYSWAAHRDAWRTRAIDRIAASTIMPAPGTSRKRASP